MFMLLKYYFNCFSVMLLMQEINNALKHLQKTLATT